MKNFQYNTVINSEILEAFLLKPLKLPQFLFHNVLEALDQCQSHTEFKILSFLVSTLKKKKPVYCNRMKIFYVIQQSEK